MDKSTEEAILYLVDVIKNRFDIIERNFLAYSNAVHKLSRDIATIQEENEKLHKQIKDLTESKVEEIILDKEQGG